MNNLSWFIYFVQLVDALTTVMIWSAVLVAAALFARFVGTVVKGEVAFDQCGGGYTASKEARYAVWRAWNPGIAKHIALFLLCIGIAAAIPSRQTMILIAGSEIGERIANSQAVSEGANLVKLWIQQETEKLKKAATK
jgi:hypothetical protein